MAEVSSTGSKANYRTISEDIFNKTGNYLSQTTIKRYFEQSEENLRFLPFVLNSLAQYVGYNDWEAFRKTDIG